MKKHLLLIALLYMVLAACKHQTGNSVIQKVQADSLVHHVDVYKGTLVETKGVIRHICGVDKRKMKLQSEGGRYIKIVPADTATCFDRDLYKRKLLVRGIVREERIKKETVAQMAEDKALLCSIDHAPCVDKPWIEKMKKRGVADSLSNRAVEQLRSDMVMKSRDYVSVVVIEANEVIIIE